MLNEIGEKYTILYLVSTLSVNPKVSDFLFLNVSQLKRKYLQAFLKKFTLSLFEGFADLHNICR